jgi:hypothetical protein
MDQKQKGKSYFWKVILFLISVISAFALALTDDRATSALWHMENVITAGSDFYIPDDDSVMTGRNNDLLLGAFSGSTDPTLISSGFDGAGKALYFNGLTDSASAVWNGADSIQIEFWIKPDIKTSPYPAQALFYLSGSLGADEVRLEGTYTDLSGGNTRIKLYHQGSQGNNWRPIKYDGQWHHVVISLDPNEAVLTLDDVTTTTAIPTKPFQLRSTNIYAGSTSSNSRLYAGLMDEVKISIPSITPTSQCGDWGYYAADLNRDCYVNLDDLLILVSEWLKS